MTTTPTPTDPLVGSTIAHYTVVAKLGGGGMGVVYKAIDGKLGRTVALKFLPPQWSHDEGAKQRFMREAQAASATNHRNICVIHDIDHTDDGRLFIVMAYYEGQTLKQRLESGPPPIGEALEIATEVAEGLAKAHAQGVVHRDIKPGNLIVSDDGVKILDFGLAKFADALQLTIPGSTIGTSGYMSPEQTRGEEADARSDVWALGVVMYEMLTGEVPFKGAYPEAIFYAIKTEPVPPLRAEGRDIPETLETIVMRALEKDPDKRYQTAREVVRDLRLLLGRTVPVDFMTGPLPPLPVITAPKPLSLWQRTRAALTPGRAIAAAVVVVAVAAGSYFWLTRPVVRIPVALAPVANRTGETDLDDYRLALSESLIDELRGSRNIRVVPYRRLLEIVSRFIGTGDISSSEAVQAIATQGGARLIVMPSLQYRSETNTWVARAEFRDAQTGTTTATYESEAVTSTLPKVTAFQLVTSLADKIQEHFGPGGAFDPVLAFFHASHRLRQRVHDVFYEKRPRVGRPRTLDAARAFERGLNNYEQMEHFTAIAALRQAAALDDQHPMIQAWLSRVALILKRRSEAIAAGRNAMDLVTPRTPPSDVAFVEAVAAESQGDLVKAEDQYRRLASIESDNLSARVELADFFRRRDRNQEAVEAFHEVLGMGTGYIRPHVDLCQVYAGGLANLPMAEQHGQDALNSFRAAGNRVGEAQAQLCLAEAQRRRAGKLLDAKRNVSAAREIFEALDKQYNLSRAYQYQGTVEYNEGNFREAARSFQEAASRSRAVENRLTEALALMNLGGMYVKLGRRAEAVASYRKSRDEFNEIGDERRAEEATINGASLQIEYGIDQDEALRRLAPARATAERLGYVDFNVLAMQAEAASFRNAGLLMKARTQLNQALQLARDQQLSNRISELTVDLAEVALLLNEYETARKSLEALLQGDGDQKELRLRIIFARTLSKLGDFNLAQRYLETVTAQIERWPELLPALHTAVGELAFESRDLQNARAHFEKAAALWTDDVPDAASVEAKSYLGLVNARRDREAADKVKTSMNQAKKMGRLALEAECRVHLARIYIEQRQYEDALAALSGMPLQSGEPTIGPELEAKVHFWRGRAFEGRGDLTGAGTELSLAANLTRRLQESLSPAARDRFAARSEIRSMLESTVRKRG